MIIRKYQPSDYKELTELFYNTVHNVNAKDCTKKWNEPLQEYFSVAAVDNENIVGFGDIDKTVYLDRLFVHADYQGKGIETAICNQRDGNKQKIFFCLTKSGQFLYDEHEKRHNLWLKRDNAFVNQFDQKTVEQVEKFMRAFNDYLEAQIVKLGGNADENWCYIKDYT